MRCCACQGGATGAHVACTASPLLVCRRQPRAPVLPPDNMPPLDSVHLRLRTHTLRSDADVHTHLFLCVRVQGGGAEPLPPHKMSPHDIVRLRPSKGDGSGPPLAEGVVYRVKDAAIIIAGGWVGG